MDEAFPLEHLDAGPGVLVAERIDPEELAAAAGQASVDTPGGAVERKEQGADRPLAGGQERAVGGDGALDDTLQVRERVLATAPIGSRHA